MRSVPLGTSYAVGTHPDPRRPAAVGIALPFSTPFVFLALVPLYWLAVDRGLRCGGRRGGRDRRARSSSTMDAPARAGRRPRCSAAATVARGALHRAAARRGGARAGAAGRGGGDRGAAADRARAARRGRARRVADGRAGRGARGDHRRRAGGRDRRARAAHDGRVAPHAARAARRGGARRRSRGWTTSTACSRARARRACRSRSRSRARRASSPPALDASAYRIVQEAVTNVIRHAGGAPAAVTVHYGDAVARAARHRRGRRARRPNGGGHGLVGMRERVAAFGGTLDAGPRPAAASRSARSSRTA